jgi:hemoglobin
MNAVASVKKDVVEAAPASPTQTLWEALGGEKGVTRLVDDFLAHAAADPKVNFSRDGKYKFDDAGLARLKNNLVDWISSLTGGPRDYHGKSMKEAHKDMGITEAEFNAAAGHMRAALQRAAAPDDIKAVMAAVESTRRAIVQPKSSAPAAVQSKSSAATPHAKALWERLGGTEKVKKIVEDFAAGVARDPAVNFSRNGKINLDRDEATALKKKLVDMISEASGGPFKYKGKNMQDSHQGMGITDAEFDAHTAQLRIALEKNGIQQDDIKELLKVIEATRKDIVAKPRPAAEGKAAK